MSDIVLTTARMTLRRMTADDGDLLFRILGDAVAMKFYPQVYSREEAEGWVTRNLNRYARDGHGFYMCELKDSGEFVGMCGLLAQDVDGERELEVGYLFVRAFWKQGLASEAARACRDLGFRTYPVAHIISLIDAENIASIRVAEKNGMTVWKETVFMNEPCRVYRITREAWERLNKLHFEI
jgi:[ribosomal protein S5]-alanine N-acetyltransferase